MTTPETPVSATSNAPTSPRLREFAPDVYVAEGPTVPFFGFPYPTRTVVVRLKEDEGSEAKPTAWVWSPIALTDDLASGIETVIGPVTHIVSPNKIHHLFLKEWADRYPDAKIYLPPGLRERRVLKDNLAITDRMIDLVGTAEGQVVGEGSEPPWRKDIDYVVFGGSFAMEEVVLFHRRSKTVIFCDLIQRHTEESNPELAAGAGWKKWLMNADGLWGLQGSTPREWRASFWRRGDARQARDRVLEDWKPEGLLIAHGECAASGATDIVREALGWI